MAYNKDNRTTFRRYSDRRNVLLLEIYKTLFDCPNGAERDIQLLSAIQKNYVVDMAIFVSQDDEKRPESRIDAAVGPWASDQANTLPMSTGLAALWELQKAAPGALTITRVKRPPVFPQEAWDDLWNQTLASQMALLSVQILPARAPTGALWLMQSNYSREWSSRDRELVEEIAPILAQARDRAIDA